MASVGGLIVAVISRLPAATASWKYWGEMPGSRAASATVALAASKDSMVPSTSIANVRLRTLASVGGVGDGGGKGDGEGGEVKGGGAGEAKAGAFGG